MGFGWLGPVFTFSVLLPRWYTNSVIFGTLPILTKDSVIPTVGKPDGNPMYEGKRVRIELSFDKSSAAILLIPTKASAFSPKF